MPDQNIDDVYIIQKKSLLILKPSSKSEIEF